MIILEGCDCTGKTTLAEKLSAEYETPITHYSKHDNDGMITHALQCEPGTGEIVDRFHMSEIPYSMYFRHEVPQYDSVKEIDLILRDRKCLQIICVPPWVNVKQYWSDRKEEEIIKNLEILHSIYMWYKNKSQAFSSFQVWQYNYILTPFESLCEKIDEWSRLDG